jgi:CRP-like cAMP-binding protein
VDTEILTISARELARLRRAGVEIDTRVVGALATAQLLAQMPMFANLSQQQIVALVGCMKCIHADAGQVVVRQGEPRHDLYVVLEGQLTLSVRDEAGEETVVAHLGRGEHFGETALYADQPYAATCRADTPVELLALDEPAFDALVASNRHMAHYVEQVSSGWALDMRSRLRRLL